LYAGGNVSDVKKLRGNIDRYRLRCGKWRILIARLRDEILVERVLDRKDAYR
jgi:mRNA-degrading endonuclease RelE of RelBE toxin-antitoxin system